MGSLTFARSDSLYYPSNTTPLLSGKLGKYGLTARRYLLENRFDLFKEWQSNGNLDEYLVHLDARYEQWKEKTVKSLRQNAPYSENGVYLTRAQHIYSVETQADEFVRSLLFEELDCLASPVYYP